MDNIRPEKGKTCYPTILPYCLLSFHTTILLVILPYNQTDCYPTILPYCLLSYHTTILLQYYCCYMLSYNTTAATCYPTSTTILIVILQTAILLLQYFYLRNFLFIGGRRRVALSTLLFFQYLENSSRLFWLHDNVEKNKLFRRKFFKNPLNLLVEHFVINLLEWRDSNPPIIYLFRERTSN